MESGRRRRRSLLSLFRVSLKKPATIKTMPVDFTAAAPEIKDDDFPATTKKSSCHSKPRRRSDDELRPELSEFKQAETDQTHDEHYKNPTRTEKLISGSPKSSPSSEETARQTPISAGRRVEPVGNRVISRQSQPAKIVKRKLTRQSLSLPATNSTAGDQPSKKLSDPIAGILILTLALLMILLWGKLCAIICTSLWLYILPRLRSSLESKNNVEDRGRKLKNLESNSDLDRKKTVVYEGFLERSRRTSPVIHRQVWPT